MNSSMLKIKHYAQGIAGLRRDDILLASFPKSGNTWIRFFFCNLISLIEWEGRVVDFRTLDSTMPELGVDNLLKPWPHRCVPRVVKTHLKYWPLFAKTGKKLFVIRDPRDVMVSLFNMKTAQKGFEWEGRFSDFIRSPSWGLCTWFEHYLSWSGRADVVLRYEEMRRADAVEFSRILQALNVSVPVELIARAVERSSFDSVRRIETKFGSPKASEYKEEFRFARSGKSGGWREYFSTEDLDYYELLKKRYPIGMY